MSEFEIVKSEYNALGEDNNYKTHYLKTSADQVVGLGRMKSFSYAVGDVVYTDNNMQVALKCTTAGTTSADELDISTVSVGESVEDGSVVWSVVSRDTVATIDKERPLKTFTSLEQLGLNNNATIEQICEAMPENSTFLLDAIIANLPNFTFPRNDSDGQFIAISNGASRVSLEFTITVGAYHEVFTANYANWARSKFSGWKQLATKGALSMPSDTILTVSPPSFTPNSATSQAFYEFYTAPADGWIKVTIRTGNANQHFIAGWCGYSVSYRTVWNEWVNIEFSLPIHKGMIFGIMVTNVNEIEISFSYAQSEV